MKLLLLVLLLLVAIPAFTQQDSVKITTPGDTVVVTVQLPNSVKDDASRALWKAEMLRLQKTVEERFWARD